MAQKIGLNTQEHTLTVPKNEVACYCIEAYDEYVLDFMLGLGHNKEKNLVCAIKYFRMRFGCGLKEAKDAVELYLNERKKQIEDEKWNAKNPASDPSLGQLLGDKITEQDAAKLRRDKEQNKGTTDLYGFAECVFRVIGYGSYHSCSTPVAGKLNEFYHLGNSSGYTADQLITQFNL